MAFSLKLRAINLSLIQNTNGQNGQRQKADDSFDYDKALTGDDLIDYVNRELFPYLQGFKQRASSADTIEYKIGNSFSDYQCLDIFQYVVHVPTNRPYHKYMKFGHLQKT